MAKSADVFDKGSRADREKTSVQQKGGDVAVAASPGTVCCYVGAAIRSLIYRWPNTRLIITSSGRL